MIFELEKWHRDVSDEELLNDLKRVSKENGKGTVTIDEYNEKGMYHSTTLTRRFGSWFDCLRLAGLAPARSRLNIPNEELFENIEELWIKLGRQPRYEETRTPLSKFSAATYENRFGTWRKALEAFVANVQRIERSEDGNTILPVSDIFFHKTARNINWRLRFLVMRRDNFKCKSCGRSPANDANTILQVDHIIPWSTGGESVLENLQTLCLKCNVGKSNLPFDENNR
jgi:hypothetical protein